MMTEMKRLIRILTAVSVLSALFVLTSCGQRVVKTYEVTDSELTESYLEEDQLLTLVKYYELSDGTWKTDDHTYKYRLEISGRMNGAAKDSTFVYLSNIESISFEKAWKAAGLSSNMDDYFDPADAVLAAMK